MDSRMSGVDAAAQSRDVVTPAPDRTLTRLSVAAAASALGYAIYRAYYGLGGSAGMFGVPASDATWRSINLAAAGLLLVAAALPLVALPYWDRRWPRRVFLVIAWLIAVACIGHALIDDVLRILSLTGRYDVFYPPEVWVSVDRRAADLQDLVFNETWFMLEGILWLAIGWTALGSSRTRTWWTGSAVVAIGVAGVVGILSGFGILGRVVIG